MQKSDNFTKKELVANIAKTTGISAKDAAEIVDAFMAQIMQAVQNGNNVELRNFGVFELQARKKRVGRNPNRPEKDVIIPDRLTVKFKSGRALKERVKKLDVKKFQK